MSKEVQQPEVNLSSEANRHLSAAAKTQEAIAAGSRGSVREKLGQILNAFGQKSFATAAVAAIIACGYGKGNQERTFTETPPPTPVVRQLEEGMPSANTPLIDSRTSTPAFSEQQAPTPELSPRETVVQLRKETQAEYSKIMDNMDKDAQKIGYYFINIAGEGKDQVYLLPVPYTEGGLDNYILVTQNGFKTFNVPENRFNYGIEGKGVNPDVDRYLKYFREGLEGSIKIAAKTGTQPDNVYNFALEQEVKTKGFITVDTWDTISYTESLKNNPPQEETTNLFVVRAPTNDQIIEVTEKSREMAKNFTQLYISEQGQRLKDAQDLSNALQSPSQPSPQPPTPTP